MSARPSQLEALRRTLALLEGFALVPIEVPYRAAAAGLLACLVSEGRRAHVVANRAQWQTLAASIVADPPGAAGVVVVLGPEAVDADVRASFRLLNQRRDTIAARLGCPLLWCGSAAFFRTTAELAPDFWSVREMALGATLLTEGEQR